MVTPLRLGLIGAGRWGRNYIKTIDAISDITLTRVGSSNPESVRLVPSNCVVKPNWRDVLDKGYVDGVIIATPPALHVEMAMVALELGLPVLIEKPLTLDLTQATALRNFVHARDGFVMVGHTHLFHPAYRALKQLLSRCGRVNAVQSEAGNFGPFRLDTPVLWDWGAHDVALCMDLLQADPVGVEAYHLEERHVPEGLGQVFGLKLLFPGDVCASIRIGNILPKTRRFSVQMDRATLIYDDLAQEKLVIDPPASGAGNTSLHFGRVPIAATPPLTQVVRDFAHAIVSGEKSLQSLDMGVRVVQVLSFAESFIKTNQAKSVD